MALSEKNKQGLLVGGIFGGALLIIIVYFGFMMIRPKVAGWDKQSEELTSKADTTEKKIKEYRDLLADTRTRIQIEDQFTRIARRLPSNQDPIEIFEILRSYFEGSAVVFNYLEPGVAKNRGAFTEYPFTIRGSARYHEFGQLVNLIECNPERLMHVTNLRLTNNERRPSIHPMEVGIATFTFNEPPATSAAAAPAAPARQ